MKNNSQIQQEKTQAEDRSEFVKSFIQSIKNLDSKQLERVSKKLNFLCLDFDPYNEHTSIESKNILTEYNLEQFKANPFEFTNILLQLLDNIEHQVKGKVH